MSTVLYSLSRDTFHDTDMKIDTFERANGMYLVLSKRQTLNADERYPALIPLPFRRVCERSNLSFSKARYTGGWFREEREHEDMVLISVGYVSV